MLLQEEAVKTIFPEMPESAKVWIYQSDRLMTTEEVEFINEKAEEFVAKWESHGNKLKAEFTILYNLFLIFVVDENQKEASGCSIDKSVHFVKEMQTATGLHFFDRTIIVYLDADNNPNFSALSGLKTAVQSGKIDNNTLIFNNLCDTINKVRTEWIVPAGSSWLARFF